MNEEETKNCPNCKRDIPAVNFTIHSVHCARNIRVCPVCKEPVPSSELDDHHQKFHKLLPCKQCGEKVCGTDLEDHLRDSCANTIKSCRFCELELPRREVPAHEAYCGVRTEQCPECREWVMIKYRQLHLDSNHGFIRLHDDPAPSKNASRQEARPRAGAAPYVFGSPVKSSAAPRRNITNGSEGGAPAPAPPARPTSIFDGAGPTTFRNDFSRIQPRYVGSSSGSSASPSPGPPDAGAGAGAGPLVNGARKRTNDQPQINTNRELANKVGDKELPISRGAIKKRPAPKPPRAAPPDPRRDLPYYSAMERQQREERQRRDQNEYNLAHGLPPVLTPAAKVEKLRKMDALQNRDTEEEYRKLMQRRSPDDRPHERSLQDFKNLKPMSTEQFMERFRSLQLSDAAQAGGAAPPAGGAAPGPDRFPQIISSLRELRRGLNEVTAPYNNVNTNNNNDRGASEPGGEEVRLPCEFCDMLVPVDDLVQHQTGCRPDLAQWRGARAAAPPPCRSPPRSPPPPLDPVIPCEFCARSLPVYLITEHQEQCAREVDILSSD